MIYTELRAQLDATKVCVYAYYYTDYGFDDLTNW